MSSRADRKMTGMPANGCAFISATNAAPAAPPSGKLVSMSSAAGRSP